MWYLNPKNIILMVLAVLTLSASGLYLWQRVELKNKEITIAKQTATILDNDKTIAALNGQVKDYENVIAAIKQTVIDQQQIIADAESMMNSIEKINDELFVGGAYGKAFCNIVEYFNNGGHVVDIVYQDSDSGAKAGGQVLSTASKAGTGKASCYTKWPVKMMVSNTLKLIAYSLEWEKTGICYGGK